MSAATPVGGALSSWMRTVRFVTTEEVEADRLELGRAGIARRARTLKGQLEPALTAPEFGKVVRDERLRAMASRYDVANGSTLIVGPAGVGKSLTVRRACRRLLGAAWRTGSGDAAIVGAAWTTAIEIATALRESRLGSTCEAMRAAQRADLLILDELGQESHDPRWLLELLESRYAPRFRPTITTSGLTLGELIGRYGTGAVRRLTEPKGMTLDLFGGQA